MIVLGAAAGGGFPQWNSNAPGCRRARSGDVAARPRTQTSVAVSADGLRWLLLNASPDLRQQIEATPSLQPATGLRSSPIVGVALTGADIDAIAGLLHMRERHRFAVYATWRIHAVLRSNSVFSVLAEDCVRREIVPLERPFMPTDMEGVPLGFGLQFFPVPGKVPLYLERDGGAAAERQSFAGEPEDNVGIEITPTADGESVRILFIPGCAEIDDTLRARLRGASVVFFDGTLWRDDEMIVQGLGEKTGRRMGHMSVDGPAGTIAALRELAIGRRIFVHINNSNPILLDDSPERAAAETAGWEVAWDGMEILQ